MSLSISCLPLPVIVAVLVVVMEDFVADPVHPGGLLWVHWIPTIHSLVDTSQTKHCLTANLKLPSKNTEICSPKQCYKLINTITWVYKKHRETLPVQWYVALQSCVSKVTSISKIPKGRFFPLSILLQQFQSKINVLSKWTKQCYMFK